ncbi:glycosyltransferase [Gordonia alkaliphila]|uniref:glycosyltransferase n=1 Tax=Gordonia alkaliphila TaxID=1053547 RepID=UPI001FF60FBB|nr:glycosyltransferase [Gordonia alkaliphila]MCK0438073.1 glycosyltransferase [Gordonia alkaliphila]
MKSTVFLLSKDPVHDAGGDVTMTRLVMNLARESRPVRAIALSTKGVSDGDVIRVPKPPVSRFSLLTSSLRSGRSLVHARFDSPELIRAIESSGSAEFVAEHSYMAESFLRSAARHSARLHVNTHVSESLVWRSTRSRLLRSEARRIDRDEYRVAQSADSVATFDKADRDRYRAAGVGQVHWLPLTLPPADRIDVADGGPNLVFLGDRTWPPNAEAAQRLLRLWPRVRAAVPDARLYLVGKGSDTLDETPEGVVVTGFVPDLAALLADCRAMIAPIATGGGVRVKLLEAASRGLPFLGTAEALGDHGEVLGVEAAETDDELVERASEYLQDAAAADRESRRLYEANRARWDDGEPHRIVEAWLDSGRVEVGM